VMEEIYLEFDDELCQFLVPSLWYYSVIQVIEITTKSLVVSKDYELSIRG